MTASATTTLPSTYTCQSAPLVPIVPSILRLRLFDFSWLSPSPRCAGTEPGVPVSGLEEEEEQEQLREREKWCGRENESLIRGGLRSTLSLRRRRPRRRSGPVLLGSLISPKSKSKSIWRFPCASQFRFTSVFGSFGHWS